MARNEPLQQSTSPIGILHELTPLPPGQNGHHFEYDIFKCIFLIENKWNSLKISLKSVPKGPINNIPALVQIKAWHQPMMVKLLTHLCGTRPQWINTLSSLNKMANVVQTTSPNAFSWKQISVFWYKYHKNFSRVQLILQLHACLNFNSWPLNSEHGWVISVTKNLF